MESLGDIEALKNLLRAYFTSSFAKNEFVALIAEDENTVYMEMAMCSIESMQQSIAEKILLYAKKLQKQYMMSYKEIFYNSLMVLYRINLETKKITQYDISHLSTYILQQFNIELEKS